MCVPGRLSDSNTSNNNTTEICDQLDDTTSVGSAKDQAVVVHKAVLMARSNYLRNMLQDNKWSHEKLIYLKEVC